MIGRRMLLAGMLGLVSACAGGTGARKFDVDAFASGHPDVAKGRPFVNDKGYVVRLDRATVTVGPVYLNVVAPRGSSTAARGLRFPFEGVAHAHGEDHLGSGRIVGEVLGQVTFDALSDARVPFPRRATVTNEPVRTVDIWLYPPPGDDPETKKARASLDVEGTAERGGASLRFRGSLAIDDAFLPDAEPGTRGARTLSEIRRIRGIAASFTPEEGGALEVLFDVREALRGCDFGALDANPKDADGAARLVQSKATGNDQVVTSLFQGLKSATGTWTVRFVSP